MNEWMDGEPYKCVLRIECYVMNKTLDVIGHCITITSLHSDVVGYDVGAIGCNINMDVLLS